MNKESRIAIIVEGGLVQTVVTDDPDLKLEIIVIDYDTDGATDEIVKVPSLRYGPPDDAVAHFETLYRAGIDIDAVRRQILEKEEAA